MEIAMLKPSLTSLVILCLAALFSGMNAGLAADGPANRFLVEKTKYGFVRLDSQTGAMTFCRENDEALFCTPTNGEKPSLEADVDSLKAQLAGLESRLKLAEEKAAKQAALSPGDRLANEQSVAGLLLMERLIGRFIDMTAKDQ